MMERHNIQKDDRPFTEAELLYGARIWHTPGRQRLVTRGQKLGQLLVE
jgi:hypothetical protein